MDTLLIVTVVLTLGCVWKIQKQQEKILMGALKNLQDAVTALNTNSAAIIVALNAAKTGVPETEVQAQADAVNVVNSNLTTALTPTSPIQS